MKANKYAFVKDRVSIVIPVFNGEKYLPTILDSVLEQTYPNIELILVDDGSYDGTKQLAERYRGSFRAKGYDYYIVQSQHKNASAAINHGLPYVSGEYLIWPDGDDRLEKDSIKKRVEFLKSHPQYQCVRSLAYYFDPITGALLPEDEKIGNLSKEDLFWDILEFKTYVCCGCYMLKSQRFFEIYPERHIPECNGGQNFQMLLPFMFFYPCPTIPEQLYGVCVRQGSHSRVKLTREEEYKKYYDYEQLVDEIASICKIRDETSKKRIMYWKIKRRYNLALKYEDKEQMIRTLWQLRKYGQKNFYYALKGAVWTCMKDTWVFKIYAKCCMGIHKSIENLTKKDSNKQV